MLLDSLAVCLLIYLLPNLNGRAVPFAMFLPISYMVLSLGPDVEFSFVWFLDGKRWLLYDIYPSFNSLRSRFLGVDSS